MIITNNNIGKTDLLKIFNYFKFVTWQHTKNQLVLLHQKEYTKMVWIMYNLLVWIKKMFQVAKLNYTIIKKIENHL